MILLSASGFGGGLRAGSAISVGLFRVGSTAGDANDRVIYNANTGALFFDINGTGSVAQIHLATLINSPTLTNTHIVLV